MVRISAASLAIAISTATLAIQRTLIRNVLESMLNQVLALLATEVEVDEVLGCNSLVYARVPIPSAQPPPYSVASSWK